MCPCIALHVDSGKKFQLFMENCIKRILCLFSKGLNVDIEEITTSYLHVNLKLLQK